VLVDVAFGSEGLERLPSGGHYDEKVFEKIQQAMRRADRIVLTHEHFDHIAGLSHVDVDDVALISKRLMLNSEQLASDEAEQFLSPELRDRLEPFDYEETLLVAPGLVLLRARGHTEGSQIVYVVLEGGQAMLLIGDVAWYLDQILNEHYRPRLITDLILGEDREAVLHQMRALKDVMAGGRVAPCRGHVLNLVFSTRTRFSYDSQGSL